MRKKYNTPHRSRVVKTRLSEDEYADFTARLAPYGISQSEFLRQAIRRATIRPVIHVSAVNDELLSAVGKLTAEYGRIGGNLNQIARYLNEYGAPYNALSGEVRAAIADLAALKYHEAFHRGRSGEPCGDLGQRLAQRGSVEAVRCDRLVADPPRARRDRLRARGGHVRLDSIL